MALNSKGEEANPLDKFQSFSNHHILMVTNTTEGLRNILRAETDAAAVPFSFENLSLTKPIPSSTDNGGSGVYVVCDSRQNSNFSIKAIEYESNLGGGNATQSQLYTGYLKMQLFDPNGMAFLNYLQYLQDFVLKCDTSSMFWNLQTMFVGHTDMGQSELITTSSIPLMLGAANSIAVNFDQTGGMYDLVFMCTAAGAASAPGGSATVGHSSASIKSDKNRTLLSVFKNFQNQMNKELKDYYDKLRVVQLPAGEDQSPSSSSVTNNAKAQQGKLVQYMFTIPEEWNDWTVDGGSDGHIEADWKAQKQVKSTSDNQVSQEAKLKPNTAKGAVSINVAADSSVDAAIKEILGHCDQLMLLAGQEARTKGGDIKIWKTISGVTSDDHTHCLHWDVVAYTIPNVTIDKTANKPVMDFSWTHDKNGQAIAPKNSLEFDYMFSGKNSDIIHFDMKMPNAIALLLNSGFTHDVKSKVLQNQKNDTKAKETKEKNNVAFLRQNTPVFMPAKTADDVAAYSYIAPGSSQSSRIKTEYTKLLADWYALSSIEIKMRIRGNPDLMVHTVQKLAPHVTGVLTSDGNANASQMKEYREFLNTEVVNVKNNDPRAGFDRHFATYPLWIKVNVYAPNTDFDGRQTASNNDFARKFWFEEYYRAGNITHSFSSDGTFTQEITMSAVQVNKANAEAEAEAAKKKEEKK